MKISKQISALVIGSAVVLGTSVAFAGNITIADNNTGSIVYGNPYVEVNDPTSWYKGAGLTGPTTEYQEVEPGMQTGAVWDLAAFVTPTQGTLGVLSGYDLKNGYAGTTIGDIFVSITPGSLTPLADPNTPYPQFVTDSTYHYDYAIHMNFTASIWGAAGTYSVIQLAPSTVIENGEYSGSGFYNAASQPWRVAQTLGNGTVISSGALGYTNTESSSAASLLAGFSVTSDYKYYATVGTSWLNPIIGNETNPDVIYKLTMECGNDNMLGEQTGGFQRVPDGYATLSLLGIGILAIAGASKFRTRLSRR